MKTIALLAALSLSTSWAYAQVYKCKAPSGAPVYSDAPCEAGRKTEQVLNIDPKANALKGESPRFEPRGAGQTPENPELVALQRKNKALSEQSTWLSSKGNLTVGEIIKLKQLRAEQQTVQREMMILRGQDTTSFDNEQRLDKLERKVLRVEREHNNPTINGRPCNRLGNNVTC
jgi:hypothetical protein